MRIAMFTNTYAPLVGGIEKSVATFAEDLRSLGNEVLVVTLQQRGETPRADDGVLRLPALPDAVSVRYAWKLPGAVGLAEALDRFAPDLIHAHQPFMLGDSAYRHAVRRGLPLVFTNHTLYERHADRVHLGELEALERAARNLAVVFANHCDAVTAPTGSIAAILGEQGMTPEIDVVPTGIDTVRFAAGRGARFREKHGIPADAFVVGHLGRLIPAKRVEFLAEAVLVYLSGSRRGHALVCGEGESASGVSSRFAEAGRSDRLTLVGNLPEDEVADAYAAMDVFVFGSLTDTQGIVLLEAMAAGIPVLAFRATGPQDLVPEGTCGRLLDPEAGPEDFARALSELEGCDHLSRWAGAARDHARSFDRRSCASALLDVYSAAHGRLKRRDKSVQAESVLDEFQRQVEAEWRLIVERSAVLRALLPTRGFPDPGG